MGNRWTRTVRASPWVQEGPAPARLLATDNGHVFQRPRATLFSCLEPGIRFQHREECTPLSISMRACDEHLACDGPLTVLVCHLPVIPSSAYIPDLRFCKASWMRLTQSAWSNAGLSIFRATSLGNTPTDLKAMGSAKPKRS